MFSFYEFIQFLRDKGISLGKSTYDNTKVDLMPAHLTALACSYTAVPSLNGVEVHNAPFMDKYLTKLCKEIYIKKPSGGYRVVVEYPSWLCRIFQKSLEIFYENSPAMPPEIVGSLPGISIDKICLDISNNMSETSYIGIMDIRKYFDNITREHIKRIFKKYFLKPCYTDNNYDLVMATLFCYKGRLPQGNPCSSLLSNIITLDSWGGELIKYCNDNKIILRIYVDNVIAVFNCDKETAYKHMLNFSQIINKFHFKCHKVRLLSYRDRIKILGAVVNKPYAPRTPKVFKKRILHILHNVERDKTFQYEAEREGKKVEEFIASVRGDIGWVYSFDRDKSLAISMLKRLDNLLAKK